MSDDLYNEAAAFDDEALAALASRGLVRRAVKLRDQAAIEATVGDEPEGTVMVRVGSEHVRFVPGVGVANGRCTCATVGSCQHLVAAIMTLRDDARIRVDSDDEPELGVADSAGSDRGLGSWVLSVDDDSLRRFVGLPALRWALARVDETADAEIVDGATCTVRPLPGIEVRFMGPALESAFCAPSGPNDRRNIALAILAMRAQHGVELPHVEPPRGAQNGTADSAAADRVLGGVMSAVSDAIGAGIAHPSATIRARFESLAVDARGIGLHRIAQLAARIEGHFEEALTLQAAADPTQLLADLALVHLVAELSVSAFAAGDVPRWLQGVARADYTRIATFDALGFGAVPWVARSGYAGMTGVLFDLESRRFVEIGSSRRSSSIDVDSQYKAPIGWSSKTSLAKLSGNRVQIGGALISPALRLSASSATTAQTLGTWSPSDLAVCEWDGSVPEPVSRLRGGTSARWAVVAVEEAGRARFDEVNQRLVWPIHSRGLDVDVVLYWLPHLEVAVGALERLADRKVSHVIGRLAATTDGRPVVSPASVVVGKQLRVLAVDRTSSEKAPRRRRARKGFAPSTVEASAGAVAVERLGSQLVAFAERGVDGVTPDELAQLSRRATEVGCVSVARVVASDRLGIRERILRAAHLVEEHRAMTEAAS